MHVECEGWCSIAQHTGRYTPEMGAVYGKCVKAFVDDFEENSRGLQPRTESALKNLADSAPEFQEPASKQAGGRLTPHGTPQFLIRADGSYQDLIGEEHVPKGALPGDEPAVLSAAGGHPVFSGKLSGSISRGCHKHTDMTHRAAIPESKEAAESMRIEAEAQRRDDEHEKRASEADAYWSAKAKAKDWDCIKADLSVHRYCGAEIKEDPRRSPEYRKKVLDGLGFGEGQTRPDLTEEDMRACREVLTRNAGAFWLEGEYRTALRYLHHDTIPTGPPVRTPPHRLKGEEADWVDEQLQKEVITGQLLRGNFEWASPPFYEGFC